MLWYSDSALLRGTTFLCRPMRKLPPDADRHVLEESTCVNVRVSIDRVPIDRQGALLVFLWTSHTARGVWSKYRPIRFMRVRSARVAFPTAQCRACPTRGMPVLLTRSGWAFVDGHSAHQAPVLHGPLVRLAWRRLSSSVDAPPAGQAVPLPCQLCMSWVCLPLQSSVAVHHTPVQRSCFAVVARAQSFFLHQLKILVQFL